MRVPLLVFLFLTLFCHNHGYTNGVAITRRSNFLSSSRRRPVSASYIVSQKNFPASVALSSSSNGSIQEDDDEGKSARSDKLLGILVLLTVPLTWGTYVPVVRFLYAIQPPVPGFVFSACYYALAAITTSTITLWQSRRTTPTTVNDGDTNGQQSMPIVGGLELGAYLFIANCLQVIGLRTVESDRAGFLVQLTTVMVPFVEAVFAGNLATVPVRTWSACVFAFIGLFVMGLDGRVVSDPLSAFITALTSFTNGDFLIIGAAILYTLHVVRLGVYARETTPMKLAASKATAETIFSVLLVGGLAGLSTLIGVQPGLLGFASSTGKEIIDFFSALKAGLVSGSISRSVLLPAVGAIFWTGWVTCAYTIYAQSFGQSRVSPTNANLIYTFQPIFTALFGWLLLGETMGLSGFVGGAIIAASVYLVASANLGGNENSDQPEDINEVIDGRDGKHVATGNAAPIEGVRRTEDADEEPATRP